MLVCVPFWAVVNLSCELVNLSCELVNLSCELVNLSWAFVNLSWAFVILSWVFVNFSMLSSCFASIRMPCWTSFAFTTFMPHQIAVRAERDAVKAAGISWGPISPL